MKNHHEFVMCELEFRITGLSTRQEIARLDGDMAVVCRQSLTVWNGQAGTETTSFPFSRYSP